MTTWRVPTSPRRTHWRRNDPERRAAGRAGRPFENRRPRCRAGQDPRADRPMPGPVLADPQAGPPVRLVAGQELPQPEAPRVERSAPDFVDVRGLHLAEPVVVRKQVHAGLERTHAELAVPRRDERLPPV